MDEQKPEETEEISEIEEEAEEVEESKEKQEVEKLDEVIEEELEQKPPEQTPKEMLEAKSIIEAALFMSTAPMTVRTLSKISGMNSWKLVQNKLKELQQEYGQRGSAIVISFEDGGYIMRLKPEYERKVSDLAKEAELSRGAIKTLAVIAKNDGMAQSKLAKMIGSSVYDHVKELVEEDFITAEKKGRTKVLKTTKKFKEYFTV
ncbi:SMC-Scp complex subunit ScpB [Candidatus Micrarchaeota archaeon]|nr:SMC-Scp complex subunit ScpB [Candidatus Micrarchaeota archaeon]